MKTHYNLLDCSFLILILELLDITITLGNTIKSLILIINKPATMSSTFSESSLQKINIINIMY